ncbi:translation initiation factor IF-2 isoform X2 [Peromyscus californicus insignis]|uniref:translation initiation factor IF-2 isoform X2 n=1 Tax=Peromyscus californicus insignis TaxID=564181 RepID=UPI0022A68A20|nr:translation initiation factor IF-2 isoform X2 [Peromyscus californicus insignis]
MWMWIRPRGRGDPASRRLPAALSARPGAVPAAAAALSPRGGRCWGGRCAAPGARLPAAPAASAPRTAASPAHQRPRPEVRAPPAPQAPAAGLQAPGWTKASSRGGTREGGESAAQPLKAHRRGREPDPAPRALSGPNQGRRRLAPRVGPAWEGPREEVPG